MPRHATRDDDVAIIPEIAMRIICPSCASHYEVEAARIAAQGQLVRCARCRDVWLVRAPENLAAGRMAEAEGLPQASAAVTIPNGEVVDFQAARTRLRPDAKPLPSREWASSLGVFAVAATLLATIAGLHAFRAPLAAHVPGAAKAYATLGIPLGKTGLALENVHSQLVADGGGTVLTLQGRIANTGSGPAPVPNLTVVVRSDAKVPLYTYTTAAPKPMLARGESVEFRSRLASPPSAGRDVRVSFAEAGAVPPAAP